MTDNPWDKARDPDVPEQISGPDRAALDAPQPDNGDLVALSGEFIGLRGTVLGLALKTGLLTVVTLGFYRFWMKTRLRRWYWSGVRVGGVPAEYVGEPLEKLLGFLIAVAFLAFYIGIVNLVLMFLSFSLFQGNFAAYLLSFAGVVPLWFYARYRARRYILARTRWRGIRFGLEPGAWGYAWRALTHWGLTLLTAGLLWPRMTFWLEKYRTDRTWFGDVKLQQDGRWQMLYPATRHIFVALVLGSVAAVLLWQENIWGISLALLAATWLIFGVVYYRVKCWEVLTNHKRAAGIVLRAEPRPWRVFWIYVFGYGLCTLALSTMFLPFAFFVLSVLGGFNAITHDLLDTELPAMIALSVLTIGFYFIAFLSWGAFTHAFVTMPRWRHFAETLTVIHPGTLDIVHQRARDESSEAEGFAEALDVGAAI